MRAPGESLQNRANFQVADSLRSLRLRFERFVEWMRAEALQGVKSYYAPGLSEEYSELLLVSEACLIANNAYDWSTACADEDAARPTRGPPDFVNARTPPGPSAASSTPRS